MFGKRKHWDDDHVIKRKFSALIPAFDPRPGRTNVAQTSDLEVPAPSEDIPTITPDQTSSYSQKLSLTLRGPNLPGVPDIEVDLASPDWTIFKAVQEIAQKANLGTKTDKTRRVWEPTYVQIDYVDGPIRNPVHETNMTSRTEIIQEPSVAMTKYHHISGSFVDSVEHSVDDSFSGSDISQSQRNHRDYHNDSAYKSMRGSSDSSSAYSGSDTMASMQSSFEVEEVDLTGLMESVVDSDEEDLSESMGNLTVRDAVRECLEKDPSDRNEEDIEILLEFTQHLRAFTNMTHSVRRALCATMVFAVVEKAGTIVMTDAEELDSWSVIINGHVEVENNEGEVRGLHLGDSFGITPTMDKLYHSGVMRTKCDDCQFVCITQTDYYRILHQGEENQRRHEKDGEVVLVTEHRVLDNGARKGHIVIKGIPDRLMGQLVEDNSTIDPTYIEDFLLTHRTFTERSVVVANQLLEWFQDPLLQDKVTRVLLLWVNNHFTDFETEPSMMEFLERFEAELERAKMHGQLRMLNFACTAKARKRTITLTRPSRDDPLHFQVVGGYEKGFGIFISKVETESKVIFCHYHPP